MNHTAKAGILSVEVDVPLKFLSNFGGTLEGSLTNCEIIFYLNWSANCAIYKADRATTFAIADTKLYLLVVTSSNRYNTKLL